MGYTDDHHAHCDEKHDPAKPCNERKLPLLVRDARAELPTGPQKVVQLPGTTPAPDLDDRRAHLKFMEDSRAATERSGAQTEKMLDTLQAQQKAVEESLALNRRAVAAAEKQADALDRIANWLEGK